MRHVLLLTALALLAGPASLTSQARDPSGFQLSRAQLDSLLDARMSVAESSAFTGRTRDRAREEAARIRERLERGDFRVGDRVALQITGQPDLPDTVVVQDGPALDLGDLGRVRLAGVLRSELQAHLHEFLSQVLRTAVIQVRPMIRVQVEGEVGSPGFYHLPADLLVGEVVMAAGGPTSEADLEEVRILRDTRVIADGDYVTQAIADGRSLDQINFVGGDRIIVPVQTGNFWLTAGRYALVAGSTILLGVQLFR